MQPNLIKFLVLKDVYEHFFNIVATTCDLSPKSYVRLSDNRLGADHGYSVLEYDSYSITFDGEHGKQNLQHLLDALDSQLSVSQIGSYEYVVSRPFVL